MPSPRFLILSALVLTSARAAFGVILLQSGDPQRNTTTPGDNSGWQYEGQFGSFLGTPVAPRYFVTAQHIGGEVGDSFIFHGVTYTTTAVFSDSGSDLRLWQVGRDIPDYAPLYQGNSETGLELRVFGRGAQRGDALSLDGTLKGWNWGSSGYVERWGRNVVAATITDNSTGWPYLQAAFDSPGVPDEAHLSVGDSSGGVFVMEDGLWKLAGINYAVDDVATQADGSDAFAAAIFDARGYYIQDNTGAWVPVPDQGINVPTSFYSTRTSARMDWIKSVIGQNAATQPAPETYGTWLTLYFSPDQIADASTTGPAADPDGDGVPNLLEYAFNLDPTFPEPVPMVASTGVRGLPLIQPKAVSASDTRLTVEYVRRTSGSGPGITYQVQWTSSLAPGAVDWETGGTESVTTINARWERVKVIDTVSLGSGAPTRFARVAVTQINATQPLMAPVTGRAPAKVAPRG